MPSQLGATRKPRLTPGVESKVDIETTAYCACGRCCGWTWGIAVRPFPVYYIDFVRGALVIGTLGAVIGAGAASGVGRVFRGLPPVTHWSSPDDVKRDLLAGAGRGLGVGAFLGGTVLPVARFWSETRIAGKQYECRTSTNLEPREPRHALFSHESIQKPWKLPWKLLTLQWFGRDGTIAGDTKHHPYGTRMYIRGWGWGVIEDIGGAIKGEQRIDLFYNKHDEALKWGRKKVPVKVIKY